MTLRESLDPDSSMWHWIAYDLHFWRTEHDLSCAQLGQHLNCARQTVSNIESGRADWKLSADQAKTLDNMWHLNGHFARLLKYARAGHDPDWFRQHLGHEAKASVLKIYELAVIPGLLQVEDYVRALFRAARHTDVEPAVESRMARQVALTRRNPPQTWILLDETVLLRRVGGAEVMRKQLARLLDVSELLHVTLRIVPLDAGAHVGLDGAFKVLTVGGSDMVYTEASGEAGRLSEDAQEIRSYSTRFDQIGAEALSREASRSRIKEVLEATK
jgi:DNA-binding XRE family transcriptional regulator